MGVSLVHFKFDYNHNANNHLRYSIIKVVIIMVMPESITRKTKQDAAQACTFLV